MAQSSEHIPLPKPVTSGDKALESLLLQRRSVREFPETSLELSDIGQLLWAAQGITHLRGLRTAPSAGALYPLELYLVTGNVDGLPAGVYQYQPQPHRLVHIGKGDQRRILAQAALAQLWVADAAAIVVLGAVYERTTRKYGKRGIRYVHMEAGHAAQNLFLQAGALGLNTVVVGAFDDEEVAALLGLPADVLPLLIMPVGRR